MAFGNSSSRLTLSNMSIFFFFFLSFFSKCYCGTIESFIYGGCSHQKYVPGSPYQSNLGSLLTSLVNSAAFSPYNNFTAVTNPPNDNVIYGLYQCRGDLSMPDCATCVAQAVTRAAAICSGLCGGVVQVERCYVKYDNTSFIGVDDKAVVLKNCGPSESYEPAAMARRDAVLASLAAAGGPYRVVISGEVQGEAQCVGDLTIGQCQDCISEAVGRLKGECGAAVHLNMYLTKCYVKFWMGGAGAGADDTTHDHDGGESSGEGEKTFAIIVGLLAGVVLLIVFLTFLSKVFNENEDGKS